mmetsp:Transcript_21486/g.69501  ORF Transcript_21486/g.69501 Transcript_21486/m.69501 type:complete len:345 (-) Transcript_21486:148-1182(-)
MGCCTWFFSLNVTWPFHTVSKDLGMTWSAPRNISGMVKRPGWGWMAMGPNHGLVMKRGRLLVPFNTFPAESKVVTEVVQTHCAAIGECAHYMNADGLGTVNVKFTVSNTADPSEPELTGTLGVNVREVPQFLAAGDRSGVIYSDDQGETWRLGGQVYTMPGSSECVVEEVGDEVLMSFRIEDLRTSGGCRHMARSVDGGESFPSWYVPSARHYEQTCVPDPTCQGSLLSLGGGQVVLTSGPTFSVRENLTIHLSTDRGRTFQRLLQINDGTAGYSDLVKLGETSEAWSVGVLVETSSFRNWHSASQIFAAFEVPKPKVAEDAGPVRRMSVEVSMVEDSVGIGMF